MRVYVCLLFCLLRCDAFLGDLFGTFGFVAFRCVAWSLLGALHCVAVRCSALQCIAMVKWCNGEMRYNAAMLQCVAGSPRMVGLSRLFLPLMLIYEGVRACHRLHSL